MTYSNINNIKDVAIIGAGPVGIYSAFSLSMLGLNSLIIDSNSIAGGQCSHLYPEKYIYDIPVFDKIKAQDLIDNLLLQQEKFKDKISYSYNSKIISIEKKGLFFELKSQNGDFFYAKSVILATGSGTFEPNRIPLENADILEGKTLFYKVDNKSLFQDKEIAILGGGDSATDWCFELSDICKKIYLIHRRDSFRSVESNIDRIKTLENDGKLQILTPFKLNHIKEQGGILNSIEIESIETQQIQNIKCDYLLAFFGLRNDNSLMKNSGINTKFNLVEVNQDMQTNIDGIFCIGDAANYKNKLKLIMLGFSESAIVTHAIYKYINKSNPKFQHSTSIFN